MGNHLKAKAINSIFRLFNHSGSRALSLIPPTRFHFPLVLHVRITSKCNLNCPFCYLKEGLNQKESGNLTIEEWKKILACIPRSTVIDITGAEPFMAPNFDSLLKLINEMGFKCSITTNGTVFNEKILESIIKNRVQYIHISLDGLKQTHDMLRGKTGAFDKTFSFLEKLKKYRKRSGKGPIINVKTMILDENALEITELLRFLNDHLTPDILTFNLLFQNPARGGQFFAESPHNPKYYEGNSAKYKNSEDLKKLIDEVEKLKPLLSFPIIFKPSMDKKHVKRYIDNPKSYNANNCSLYQNNLTLYYDGTVTPCDINLKLGNIRDLGFDLKQTYQLKKFEKFKSTMGKINHVCAGCVFSKQKPSPSG